MAGFVKFNIRMPEDQHRSIIQYAEKNNRNTQDIYTEVIQSFLNSIKHDFKEYIEPSRNNKQIGISIGVDTYNELSETADRLGHYKATMVNTAVMLFLQKVK